MSLGDNLRAAGVSTEPPTWIRRPEILLCGNVPKPLHGLAPRVVLGAKWWDATRRAAYKSTDDHCLACGVPKHLAEYHQWLEGHEVYRVDYVQGVAEYLETVPLCHYCHNFIHDGRLKQLLEKGEIHQTKYVAIIQHGERVLHVVGLAKPEPYLGPFAEWKKWRLIVFGKKYKPLWKSLEQWERHFNE